MANYAQGLNEFSYRGSLHISHFSPEPAVITEALGLVPTRETREGDSHRSVANRRYEFSHWSVELPTVDGEDIPSFLRRVVDLLSPHGSFLTALSDEGAEIECFVGVFSTQLCDQSYPHELLAAMAELRIDLRLDYYKPDGSQSAS